MEKAPLVAEFIPLEGIARKVVLFLYINLGLEVANGFMSVVVDLVGDPDPENMSAAAAIALVLALIVCVVRIITYITCGVFFCKWMYRAYMNAIHLSPALMTGKDAKSTCVTIIGSWFIPFVNLWWPFRHMKTLWRSSDARSTEISVDDWKTIKVPSEFGWWWATWIIQGALGQAAFRSAMRGGAAESLSTGLDIGSSAFAIVSAILAVKIVRTITERQMHKIHVLTSPAR